MLFRLCEHYENTFPRYKQDISNECFICFEYKNDNGILPICLNSQNLYLNECVCNGSVHIECLKIWFNKNKKCPICRIQVIENNNTTIVIYNYIPFGITIYTYTKKIIISAIRVFSCMLVLFLIIDFYFMIVNTKYREYKYKEYNFVEDNDYTHTLTNISEDEYIK